MKEFGFGMTIIASKGGSLLWPDWNGGSRFYPDLNSLKWRKSVLVGLEMKEVGFKLNGMAWNGGSGF
jgi:hypothetical protein